MHVHAVAKINEVLVLLNLAVSLIQASTLCPKERNPRPYFLEYLVSITLVHCRAGLVCRKIVAMPRVLYIPFIRENRICFVFWL